jgi:glutathionyl-hydroquinone reductase
MVRELKGLEKLIPVSVVDWLLEEGGWKFNPSRPGCTPEPLYDSQYLKDLYKKADPSYSGRITVPVLWDKKSETIVNNESVDIIRMFNSAFNALLPKEKAMIDLYPEEHRKGIDELNDWIYDGLNNGVYRAGFATKQEPYEEAATQVHEGLKRVENILGKQEFMHSSGFSEVDIRLFTTIVRFDPVYFGHFKCNMLAVRDCPNTLKWLKKLYKQFKDTVNMEHIKNHYYQSHKQINPSGIVPLSNGPNLE